MFRSCFSKTLSIRPAGAPRFEYQQAVSAEQKNGNYRPADFPVNLFFPQRMEIYYRSYAGSRQKSTREEPRGSGESEVERRKRDQRSGERQRATARTRAGDADTKDLVKDHLCQK
jgi:hypothetical protein